MKFLEIVSQQELVLFISKPNYCKNLDSRLEWS